MQFKIFSIIALVAVSATPVPINFGEAFGKLGDEINLPNNPLPKNPELQHPPIEPDAIQNGEIPQPFEEMPGFKPNNGLGRVVPPGSGSRRPPFTQPHVPNRNPPNNVIGDPAVDRKANDGPGHGGEAAKEIIDLIQNELSTHGYM